MAKPEDRTVSPGSPTNPTAARGDNPQEDWGDPAGEGAVFSSNHADRGRRTELERGQGAKTRRLNKDTISRRV